MLTALLMLSAVAQTGMAQPIDACAAPSLCGFDDPEDLADLAGTSWLLVSQASAGEQSGLAALDTRSDLLIRYTTAELGDTCLAGSRGGGIGIRRDRRGFRLVRVLHARGAGLAGEDGIETYRVTIERGRPRLKRTGCMRAPQPLFLNDVEPLPDGGFAATHMFDPALSRHARETAFLARRPTGFVVRWSPRTGWRRLPESEGTFPNGIAASSDGRWLVFAETYGRAVSRISIEGGMRTEVALEMQPDNVTALGGKRFTVAGGTGAPLVSTRGCPEMRRPGCGFPALAVTVDFASGGVVPLAVSGGARTAGFSVGIVKGKWLYLGTAFGDRLTRGPLAETPIILP